MSKTATRAGPDNSPSQAYFGLSSKKFGTLTYGRQYSLIMEDMYTYDPMARSKAFSPIGYSGLAAGGGDTEDARLGNSIKYAVGYGPAHFAVHAPVPRRAATFPARKPSSAWARI